MGDYIDRQDALKTVGLIKSKHDKTSVFSDDFDVISRIETMIAISNLSSAEIERKKGEWIQEDMWIEGCGMGETYGYYWRCSNCDEIMKGDYYQCGANFCPNCGSDNRGE